MTTKIVNNEDHPTEIYPRNTHNTAVWVRGVRGVPKSYTIPEPVLPVLETPRVSPYTCGTLRTIDHETKPTTHQTIIITAITTTTTTTKNPIQMIMDRHPKT